MSASDDVRSVQKLCDNWNSFCHTFRTSFLHSWAVWPWVSFQQVFHICILHCSIISVLILWWLYKTYQCCTSYIHMWIIQLSDKSKAVIFIIYKTRNIREIQAMLLKNDLPCILRYSYFNTHIDGEINANKMGGGLTTIELWINFNMFSHLSVSLFHVPIYYGNLIIFAIEYFFYNVQFNGAFIWYQFTLLD